MSTRFIIGALQQNELNCAIRILPPVNDNSL